jgi:organic radical activating enzyme
MNNNKINVDNMLKRFDDVKKKTSDTMCLAKWLQSTVNLSNGFTHSCHHPSQHKIDPDDLTIPSNLHNTPTKIQARKEMLEGERPSECTYCWNVEDLEGDHISDRVYKSTALSWAYPHLKEVIDSKEGETINPSYLEIAFDNTCNLKCMYCTPDVSSKWMEEIKKYGKYNTSYNLGDLDWLKQSGRMPIPNREVNPYVDAFFEWWPDLYESLDVFRITGGEPLLSKNTFRVLEEIKKNPRKDLILAVNTNLMVDESILKRFIDLYNDIAPNIKEFQVFTSCEAHGKQAEYIRYGMDYNEFMKNCNTFLEETTGKLHFMIAFNGLSVTTFEDFMGDILRLRSKFNTTASDNRVPMMINYIRWPQFQDIRIIPRSITAPFLLSCIDYAKTQKDKEGMFYIEEIDQLERLYQYSQEGLPSDYRERQNKDFGIFYEEYDKRRNVDFHKLFPELSGFLNNCK